MENTSSFGNPALILLIFTATLCSLITLVGVAITKRRAYDVSQLMKPSGAHWLWGHEREAWETPDAEWYMRNTAKHGLVFAMKGALLHPDVIAVTDPAALHHIFTNSQRFVKSTVFRPWLERLLGRGLLWAEGSEHTRQRQMVAPLFTAARVKTMEDDVQAATERFIDKFRQHIVSGSTFSSAKGLRVDVLAWLTWPTLDIIGKVTLGHDFGCGETPEAQKIHTALKGVLSIGMTFAGFAGPLVLRAFPWIGDLPFSVIQAQGDVKVIVKDIARQIVEDIKQAEGDEVRSRNDLLGKLIKNTDANNDVDVDMMLDQISTIVMAGHETVTNTIAMTLLELARSPDIQTALRAELKESRSSRPDGTFSYDDISGSSLPLLDAVCKEGLRIWPIGSNLDRVATEDDVIPLRFPLVSKTGSTLNAIRVRKGQIFYTPTIAIHSNTQVWGDDGRKFDPYRWIDPGRLPLSSSLTGGINGLFGFIEGPRLCVGYRLAIFEFKVILAAMIKDFEFRTTDDLIQTIWATTLQPFVQGEKELGPQLPLFVRPVDM